MLKSRVLPISLGSYTEDIRNSIIRGHKFFRNAKQFNENEEISKTDVFLFLKKIKKAKTLRAFKLQLDHCPDMRLKLGIVRSALKGHCQRLRELDVSGLPSPKSYKDQTRNFLCANKKITTLSITNDFSLVKNLSLLRKVENLFINMTTNRVKTDLLYKALANLGALKDLCLLILPSSLDQILLVLNKFSTTFRKQIRYQILTKEDHPYNEPDFSLVMLKNLNKLSLQYLNSDLVIHKLFSIQPLGFSNLKNLKLGFSIPDLNLLPYLRSIEQISFLERLSLSFSGSWGENFIEQFFEYLHLPVLLEDLKLTMPLSFKKFMVKYVPNVEEEKEDNNDPYPWRKNNFFEEEPLFAGFLDTLEKAHYLKKIEMFCQMTESFSSYYTNFFVSIINRLPSLSSFVVYVSDHTLLENFTTQIPQPFDLALLFQACSRIERLEHLEVLMPNLLFEDAEIDHTMTHLKKFTIGVIENEDEGVFQFQSISKRITRWLKKLLSIAPNLSNLILDFTEVIDESTFCRRFTLIERFKQLETYCSKFAIGKCSIDTANQVGKMIQSLQKLHTLILRFIESDRNVLQTKKYINHIKTLREVLVSFDQKNWMRKNDETELSNADALDEEFDSFYASSLNDEAVELDANEFGN